MFNDGRPLCLAIIVLGTPGLGDVRPEDDSIPGTCKSLVNNATLIARLVSFLSIFFFRLYLDLATVFCLNPNKSTNHQINMQMGGWLPAAHSTYDWIGIDSDAIIWSRYLLFSFRSVVSTFLQKKTFVNIVTS